MEETTCTVCGTSIPIVKKDDDPNYPPYEVRFTHCDECYDKYVDETLKHWGYYREIKPSTTNNTGNALTLSKLEELFKKIEADH